MNITNIRQHNSSVSWSHSIILTIVFLLLSLSAMQANAMPLTLTSTAFSPNGFIPSEYTCEGSSRSPGLNWHDDLLEVKTYVVTMDDPDTSHGTWDHWVLFNIPVGMNQLPESASTPFHATDGNNSWGQIGYRGPCPPTGTHRYFFKLYALDTVLQLPEGSTKADVLKAMKGHIIANAELVGVYQKRK